MIFDHLSQLPRYTALNPGFLAAYDYLYKNDISHLSAGRHEIQGDKLFVVMNRAQGRGKTASPLESHRKYIDIQLGFVGTDEIGWKRRAACEREREPYSDLKDLSLYDDVPDTWIAVPPQHFAILFPEDAHAPMGAAPEVALVKAVLKVAVNWW